MSSKGPLISIFKVAGEDVADSQKERGGRREVGGDGGWRMRGSLSQRGVMICFQPFCEDGQQTI